jgi:hypothetical protein
MRKSTFVFAGNLILMGALVVGVSACTDNQPSNQRAGTPVFDNSQNDPTINGQNNPRHNDNDGYDNDGGDPAPNNGNQNFGRRW